MQSRQNRAVPIRPADFDGVMLVGAVIGAKDMQTPGLGRSHGQPGGNNRMQLGGAVQQRYGLGQVHLGQPLGRNDAPVGNWQNQNRG